MIIDALHGPLPLNCAETALIVVDMQNNFCSKEGLFHQAGINISSIEKIIAPMRRVLSAARGAGIRIVYLKMGFQPDLSDLGDINSPSGERHQRLGVGQPSTGSNSQKGRFLIRDTWNTDIIEELRPEPGEIVVYKHRFSGFYQTELDHILRGLGVRNLIFTGCTTSVCVESTIRDAMFRDYRCVLLEDCAGEPLGNESRHSNHEASILTIQAVLGWVSNSAGFESALRRHVLESRSD